MTRISWFCVGALVPSMLLAALILAGVAQYLLGSAFTTYAAVVRARVSLLATSARGALRSVRVRAAKPVPAFPARLSHA